MQILQESDEEVKEIEEELEEEDRAHRVMQQLLIYKEKCSL